MSMLYKSMPKIVQNLYMQFLEYCISIILIFVYKIEYFNYGDKYVPKG